MIHLTFKDWHEEFERNLRKVFVFYPDNWKSRGDLRKCKGATFQREPENLV